jgi:hypothetical protein
VAADGQPTNAAAVSLGADAASAQREENRSLPLFRLPPLSPLPNENPDFTVDVVSLGAAAVTAATHKDATNSRATHKRRKRSKHEHLHWSEQPSCCISQAAHCMFASSISRIASPFLVRRNIHGSSKDAFRKPHIAYRYSLFESSMNPRIASPHLRRNIVTFANKMTEHSHAFRSIYLHSRRNQHCYSAKNKMNTRIAAFTTTATPFCILHLILSLVFLQVE